MRRVRRCGGRIPRPYVGGRLSTPYLGGRMGKGRRRIRDGEGIGTVLASIAPALAKVGTKVWPKIKSLFSKGKKVYKAAKKYAEENPEVVNNVKKLGKDALAAYKARKNGVTQKTSSPQVIANQNMNDMPLANNMKSNPTDKIIDPVEAARKKVQGLGKFGGRKRRRGRPCTPRKGRGSMPLGIRKFGGRLMRGPIA